MSTLDETFAAVEDAVLAVPGVTELYRARPTIGSAVAAAKTLATRGSVARVVLDDDVLRIVIGTDGSHPAPETARAAHVAALAVATERGLALSRVDVRVARVG
ncbi:hypothetical protein [Curtobacterium pusillum]|uniref:hypothetical protein n=1 Tax=Curtobacterium pusillum TaxID=69373 RepID=UPI00119FAA62|nr:hypothetical protein [Curtobacterium pusillum]